MPSPHSIPPAPVIVRDLAGRRWDANFAANCAALHATQPDLIGKIIHAAAPVAPIFARDGSLTAFDSSGNWLAGCSLPVRAAASILRSLDISGEVACFVSPPHAGFLSVALARLLPRQAIIALVPDRRTAWEVLGCCDFSADITSHRLWFVTGSDWATELDELLIARPGLPTPRQFIRLPTLPEADLNKLTRPALAVFSSNQTRRSASIAYFRDNWRAAEGDSRRLRVIVPSHFRLWADVGAALNALLDEPNGTLDPILWLRHDCDDPCGSSPVALVSAATLDDALLTADLFRADLPNVIPNDMPWLTWVTTGRVPAFESAGPKDGLLVADLEWGKAAIERGWPAQRVVEASWPKNVAPASMRLDSPSRTRLALIADTSPLEPDAAIVDFSSHHQLWEAIRNELLSNPFILSGDPLAYLAQRARALQVDESTIDRIKFVERLIVPAFVQGIAAALRDAGLPLAVAGAGWERVGGFEAHHTGPAPTRDDFRRAIADAGAVVHPWPSACGHPIDAVGKPVVRAWRTTRERLVQEAKAALGSHANAAAAADTMLGKAAVLRLLRRIAATAA